MYFLGFGSLVLSWRHNLQLMGVWLRSRDTSMLGWVYLGRLIWDMCMLETWLSTLRRYRPIQGIVRVWEKDGKQRWYFGVRGAWLFGFLVWIVLGNICSYEEGSRLFIIWLLEDGISPFGYRTFQGGRKEGGKRQAVTSTGRDKHRMSDTMTTCCRRPYYAWYYIASCRYIVDRSVQGVETSVV